MKVPLATPTPLYSPPKGTPVFNIIGASFRHVESIWLRDTTGNGFTTRSLIRVAKHEFDSR